ncbi:MAG: signal recognition particle protein [Sutterella parvirubra]|nr:signal recognition particle protein [Sutterella parvirubra]
MLDSLSQRLSKIVKVMRGQARLTEENTRDMLREIRLALLEADVALPVVREVLARIKEKAMGEEVIGNLNPGQALVGVVQRELTAIMGGDLSRDEREINLRVQPPAVILLAGLQGAGKTTTAGKLAKHLIETQKKKVLTVSCDIYRPAAIEQLKTVTAQAGAEWYPSHTGEKPLDIAAGAVAYARRHFFDVLIVDTAGRLAIDEAMMTEVADLHKFLSPAETLFVIDAMLGQDAVNTAKSFHERLPLTGVILTKTDGDSRGGAALSVRHVTGKPIKFVGSGEKLDGFDAFDPEAMASRIIGMGDIVGLVKDVQKSINVAEAEKLAQKLKSGKSFDLTDFRAQLAQMGGMGSFSSLMEKLPAQFQQAAGQVNDEQVQKQLRRTMGIIDAMTPAERRKPDLIKASRKKRIAMGAGVPVQEVNRLLKQFDQTQDMMKRMQRGGLSKMMRALGGMGLPGMGKLGGFPGMGGFGGPRG